MPVISPIVLPVPEPPILKFAAPDTFIPVKQNGAAVLAIERLIFTSLIVFEVIVLVVAAVLFVKLIPIKPLVAIPVTV